MLEIRAFARKSLDRIFVLRRFEIENERCEMIDKARLEQKCSMWNIALTGDQLDQLDAFAQILVDYNQKVNLTAITDPEGIEDKHFLDSLLFASQPEVAGKMVDVGAGAGFPGIVTKIYKPELELTLMEPRQAGGVLEVCLRSAGPDRGGVCQGARRGSRPQGVAGTV